LFVSSRVEGRIAIKADGWETYYLPPDTDPATVAEVKAALDHAMQIEIEAEKPGVVSVTGFGGGDSVFGVSVGGVGAKKNSA
jgi:hypothetical protein